MMSRSAEVAQLSTPNHAATVLARVVKCGDMPKNFLAALLSRYGVRPIDVAAGATIPGSFWGPPEAGRLGNCLYLRPDTPLHSALHELSHYVCVSEKRRAALTSDAGGDSIEECAVCYLQLLLAREIDGFGRERGLRDMDVWGYSFREGSAAAWFAGDGIDARNWLERHHLIDASERPTWRLRT
jgi:hypothetical protein